MLPDLKMKQILTFLFLVIGSQLLLAQGNTITYSFNDTLSADNNAGPKLQRLGTGYFRNDTIPCTNQVRRVYHFDDNMGLQFDNNAAGNWFKKSYTIELYFKMDEMNSWKRVVDYKNRTSDWGCYVFYGKLNFYNIATSDTIPFAAGKYQYYTVTRDSVTKKVKVFSSGSSRIEFTDVNDQAVLSSANLLNFFQDDLMVQNEASPGEIALLRLTNYPLDSATVKSRFTNLCSTLTGTEGVQTEKFQPILFPNPASNHFSIQIPDGKEKVEIRLTGLRGETIREWYRPTNLDLSGIAPGLYLVRINSSSGNSVQKLRIE
jgi:OOP family OmpA-OmpF porin